MVFLWLGFAVLCAAALIYVLKLQASVDLDDESDDSDGGDGGD